MRRRCQPPRRDGRRGTLTVAHTSPREAKQAVAVATNLETGLFEGVFDVVVRSDFAPWTGYRSTLDAYELSPFDETLYVDADCLASDAPSCVFAALDATEVGVFGCNVSEDYWRFISMDEVRRLSSSATYPSFNSGVMFFRRSAVTPSVFRSAKEMSLQYDALGMRRLNGHMADEPLFGAAMACAGLRAHEDASSIVHALVSRSLFGVGSDIDVLAGQRALERATRPSECFALLRGEIDRLRLCA